MTNNILTSVCLLAMIVTVATCIFHAAACTIDDTLFEEDDR